MLASQPNHLPRVNMNPAAHFGNAWRDPTGKVLTNHAITKRLKEGWYGEEAKLRALKKATSKNGFIDRCKCGEVHGVKHYDYKWMAERDIKPGFFCPKCLATARGQHVPRPNKHRQQRDITEFI